MVCMWFVCGNFDVFPYHLHLKSKAFFTSRNNKPVINFEFIASYRFFNICCMILRFAIIELTIHVQYHHN